MQLHSWASSTAQDQQSMSGHQWQCNGKQLLFKAPAINIIQHEGALSYGMAQKMQSEYSRIICKAPAQPSLTWHELANLASTLIVCHGLDIDLWKDPVPLLDPPGSLAHTPKGYLQRAAWCYVWEGEAYIEEPGAGGPRAAKTACKQHLLGTLCEVLRSLYVCCNHSVIYQLLPKDL